LEIYTSLLSPPILLELMLHLGSLLTRLDHQATSKLQVEEVSIPECKAIWSFPCS
jgi:hypothetical protein